MTTIKVTDKKILVQGHSGYAEEGKDIVCAAISVLTEGTYNYLRATFNVVETIEDEGLYEIRFNFINDVGRAIINEYKKMIKDIEGQYTDYIRSEFNEES